MTVCYFCHKWIAPLFTSWLLITIPEIGKVFIVQFELYSNILVGFSYDRFLVLSYVNGTNITLVFHVRRILDSWPNVRRAMQTKRTLRADVNGPMGGVSTCLVDKMNKRSSYWYHKDRQEITSKNEWSSKKVPVL